MIKFRGLVNKCVKNLAGEGEPGEAAGAGGARRRLEHLAQPGPLSGLRGEGPRGAERAGPQGPDSIEKNGLSFGLKNGLRFRFDSETCLNYPFLNIFLV